MHTLGTLALLGLMAAGPTTLVDFKLLDAAPATPAPLAEPASPDEQPPPPARPWHHAQWLARPRPHIPLAEGFGNQVPLSFAVRQIVPRGVSIRLEPGVDADAPVTWAGGGPWNQVLATAVAPLGYRVRVGWEGVTISD